MSSFKSPRRPFWTNIHLYGKQLSAVNMITTGVNEAGIGPTAPDSRAMSKPPPKSLLSLPTEILLTIPSFLHDIENFTSFTSTCRLLHDLGTSTSPTTIFGLAATSSRVFFRPSPHFLVAAVARQIGDWARSSTKNADCLKSTLAGGIDALLDLCLEPLTGCGLTMQRIRELHALRYSTINPVTDLIDKCIGEQWYATPGFWTGGADDAYTIDGDPDVAIFHLAIYGGLFSGDFDILLSNQHVQANADGRDRERMLGLDVRLEYIKYCIPDETCYVFSSRLARESEQIDSRRAVQAEIGPYVILKEDNGQHLDEHGHQLALLWLLRSRRFNRYWNAVVETAGLQSFDKEGWSFLREDEAARHHGIGEPKGGWKQNLWEAAVLSQGLEGLEMLARAKARWKGPDWMERIAMSPVEEYEQEDPDDCTEEFYRQGGNPQKVRVDRGEPEIETLDQTWTEKMQRIREQIASLEEPPEAYRVGTKRSFAYPFLSGDLVILQAAYWGG